MSGSATLSSALEKSSSSELEAGSGAVVSSCGYWVARLLGRLLVGVERRLKVKSVSILSRVKDWVEESNIRVHVAEGCWLPV